MSLLQRLLTFFLPARCPVCGRSILPAERVICEPCRSRLPFIKNDKLRENALMQTILPSAHVFEGSAMLSYEHGSPASRLILRAKFYRDRTSAHLLSCLLAERYAGNRLLQQADILVPMPSHPDRLLERGMDHVQLIARHMLKELRKRGCKELPTLVPDAVQRTLFIASQTKQTDFAERRKQVSEHNFHVSQPQLLDNRTILLFDDVVTSGATATALATAIHATAPSATLLLLAIAQTKRKSPLTSWQKS